MDYGGYNSAVVNAHIDRALSAATVQKTAEAWGAAAAGVMDDAAIVPLIESKSHFYRSARTRNCAVGVFGLNCDLNAIWLSDAVQK